MDKLQSSVLVALTMVTLLVGCATPRPPTPATSPVVDDVASSPPVPPPSRVDQALAVIDQATQIGGMATGIVSWPLAAVTLPLAVLGTVGQDARQWCAAHPDHAGVWARIRCGAPTGATP